MSECEGQLSLVCEACDGQRVVGEPAEAWQPCDECDGTGIDPNSFYIATVVRGFYMERRFDSSADPA